MYAILLGTLLSPSKDWAINPNQVNQSLSDSLSWDSWLKSRVITWMEKQLDNYLA